MTSTLVFGGCSEPSLASRAQNTLSQLQYLVSGRRSVEAYVTTADGSSLLSRDASSIAFANKTVGRVPTIDVNEDVHFQTVDGFGAELTGSAAYVIAHSSDRGAHILDDLFESNAGPRLSYIRLTLGASDFSLGSYTYDDVAPGQSDPTLQKFSLSREVDVLAVARDIRARSHDVGFLASPWTAPAWMKTSGALFGGTLKPSAYDVYGRYLAEYVRQMSANGVAIDALTLQNEPLLNAVTYPSMTLTALQERELIKVVAPIVRASSLKTKLIINDHNWEGEKFPLTILSDALAARDVDGSAFHCYAGDVAQMTLVHDRYPDKGIYLTECSGGAWSPRFADNLRWDVLNLIIGATRNWARTIVLGNLALDDASGPVNGGCSNCRGVVTVHSDGTFSRNVEYYVLGHIARFVRPGAVRIGSSASSATGLSNVAFSNVDGSRVVIVFNGFAQRMRFAIRDGGPRFYYTLPAGALATFYWR